MKNTNTFKRIEKTCLYQNTHYCTTFYVCLSAENNPDEFDADTNLLKKNGVFLFLKKGIAENNTIQYIDKLCGIAINAKKGTRFIWINNTIEQVSDWDSQELGIIIHNDSIYLDMDTAFFELGQYTIEIQKTDRISFNPKTGQYCAANSVYVLGKTYYHASQTTISLNGGIEFETAKSDVQTIKETFDPCFCLQITENEHPENTNKQTKEIVLKIDIKNKSSGFSFDFIFHPLFHLDSKKTYIKFSEKEESISLLPGYITNLGKQISLVPRGGGLALNKKSKGKSSEYYFSLQGKYLVEDEYIWLCGTGSSECIETHSSLYLYFISGKASEFYPESSKITDNYTMPWITALGGNSEKHSNAFFCTSYQEPEIMPAVCRENPFMPFCPFNTIELGNNPLEGICFPALPLQKIEGSINFDLTKSIEPFFKKVRYEKIMATGKKTEKMGGNSQTTDYSFGRYSPENNKNFVFLHTNTSSRSPDWCIFGNTENNNIRIQKPSLLFSNLKPFMYETLSNASSFTVISDAEALLKFCSVPYQITMEAFEKLNTDNAISKTLLQKISVIRNKFYDSEQEFEQAIKKVYSIVKTEELRIIEKYSGTLVVKRSGCSFNLSPRSWKSGYNSKDHTLMVFKNRTDQTISQLVENTHQWTASELSGDIVKTQQILKIIIEAARDDINYCKKQKTTSVYQNFIQIVDNKNFSGMLVLNCPTDNNIPLFDIPVGAISAHHISISNNTTTYSMNTQLDMLVDWKSYREPDFLSEEAYGFTLQSFRLIVRNSTTNGTCRALMKISRIFDSDAYFEPAVQGDSIALNGVLKNGVNNIYFTAANKGEFRLMNSVLQSVELTEIEASNTKIGANTQTAFNISGKMRFAPQQTFDPFCYGKYTDKDKEFDGYLSFSGIKLIMQFDPKKNKAVFKELTESLVLNTSGSRYRPSSLVGKFPVNPVKFISSATEQKVMNRSSLHPKDLNYTGISAPLAQGELGTIWYGLVWEVDMGNLGSLAASTGITLRVLAAWSNNNPNDTTAIYLGIQLYSQSGKTSSFEWNIQQVFKLNFKSIMFCVSNGLYSIRLRNFALRILGIALPPGYNDIYLFAGPNKRLGWYAAYSNGK